MSRVAELEKRIIELERRIAELEAMPRETHTHFHSYASPLYQQPYTPPVFAPNPTPIKYTTANPIPMLTTAGGNYQ